MTVEDASRRILERADEAAEDAGALRWFLGPEAAAAADEVRAGLVLPDGKLLILGLLALGYAGWGRYVASDATDAAGLGEAVLCFADLHREHPDQTPPDLRPVLATLHGTPEGAGTEPGQAYEAGAAVLTLYQQRRMPVMLLPAAALLRHAAAGFPPGGVEHGTCLSDLGLVHLHAARDGAGHQALTEAVELSRAAVAAAPGDRPEQARRHANLGFVLTHRAEVAGDTALAAEAVAELRHAVELSTAGDPNHALYHGMLGTAIVREAVERGDPAALPEAIGLLREAVAAADPALPPPAAHLSDLGTALIMRAMSDGDGLELYEEGVATCRRAADTAGNLVERVLYLANLGLILNGRAMRTGHPGALDDAYAAARDAVAAAPPGHPSSVQAHVVLAGVLRSRHTTRGSLGDLDEAVVHARRAWEETPADDPRRRASRGIELAELLRLHADATGAPDRLAEPLALLRRLADEVPRRSAERARVLLPLARCLNAAAHTGPAPDPALAAEAIALFRECLTLPPPGESFEATARFALGAALARGAGPDDEAVWREGAEQLRRGLELLPPGDARRSEYLSDHAAAHAERAAATGDTGLYEEALRLVREAVAHAPAGSASEEAMCRSNLGVQLATLAHRTGDGTLLAEAVDAHRQAVELSPPDDHHLVHRMGNLGDALQNLAEFRSDPALVQEAITVLREAVAASRPDTPSRVECLTRLGHALRSLFRFTGDPAPLEEAVRWHREAVAASTGAPKPGTLLGLANSLLDHYRHTQAEQPLDEALEFYRAALAATPRTSGERAVILGDLGHAEWCRAVDLGDPALMDAAVARLREAVADLPPGQVSNGGLYTNLGTALMGRARITGDRTWQAEAVAVLRRSVADSPPTSFVRAGLLSNLAEALRGWYEITEDPAAADEAAALLREARALDRGERIGQDLAALNLGLLLHNQALAKGEADARSTAESREALEEAVAAFGEHHPWRPLALLNLAGVLMGSAYLADDETGSTAREALHRAVSAAREALGRVPEGGPEQARAQWILAMAQVRRAILGERVDLAEAARLARTSARNTTASITHRLLAARAWGEAAARAGRDADALDGYAYAVGLLRHAAPRSLQRADQEARLQVTPGLASDAAALALRAGDPGRALALLEEGRAVLLAQGLENRGDVTRLRATAPALADEFEEIRDRLSTPPARPPVMHPGTGVPVPPDEGRDAGLAAEARHAQARRWDELLAEIRALPGLDGFLRPPTLPDLLTAAAEGPVVVVNVSEYRSDALLVTADAGIEVLPLPGLTPQGVLERATEFVDVIDEAYGEKGAVRAVAAMRTLTGTLRWLWDTVAAPVLDRLGLRTVPLDGEPWPRIWWCPTGWLSFLPLHAAGRGTADSGTWVLDRAVSSYTPTLRALARARARLAPGAPPRPAPLVVALAETPGGPPLPGASREAELLTDLFPDGRLLSGADATVEAVARALPAHPWVHFSCHGVSDLLHPSESGLVLHDGRLTAFDAAAQRPARPELAVLSACSTSQGGLLLPDEVVQLAPSFQLAGYPHVIGTLWTVSDKLATRLTEQFYAALAEDVARGRPVDPALALHRPLRALRNRYARAPHLWAAHIHSGP
ncbi:CHAT domain-containing protein [Streptomyces sp. I05A-00742]|uniref:CHAT domain-containing protein n=1 Tax=Streptomyces sp. I05A-00742 TaxID=2732853 RepID=UPI00148905F8|nr:CHAT domain-containing protein [Streptomyces sp. I05A-00742]